MVCTPECYSVCHVDEGGSAVQTRFTEPQHDAPQAECALDDVKTAEKAA